MIIQVGQVFEIYENEITCPHNKIHIIVGISTDNKEVASVFVNSSINYNFLGSAELLSLQYKIEPNNSRPYISRVSFVDCSELRKSFVRKFIEGMENGGRLKGLVSKPDMNNIIALIQSSETILPYYLDYYNLKQL